MRSFPIKNLLRSQQGVVRKIALFARIKKQEQLSRCIDDESTRETMLQPVAKIHVVFTDIFFFF